MRLTCPNCNAQYEVDETVIPKGGRDVQCSACGHTWYQYPLDIALQMRATDLDDDEDEDGDAEKAADTPRGGHGGVGRAAPRIDKTVLDVLREEAEREMTERQRSRTAIETQGDLGLTRPTRSKAAPSRIYGEDDAAPPPPPIPAAPDKAAPPVAADNGPVRRRNLLPDIEELTSTLEPGSERRSAESEAGVAAAGGDKGFRGGLTLVMLIAAALVALYLLAPIIVHYLPVARPALVGYVGVIDGLRTGIAGMVRGLFGG